MNNLKQPAGFQPTGNLREGFKKWTRKFENYLEASGGAKLEPKVQVSILLHCCGDYLENIYETLELKKSAENGL